MSASPLRNGCLALSKRILRYDAMVRGAARPARQIELGRFPGWDDMARCGQRQSDSADAGRAERGPGVSRHQHEMCGLPRQLYQSLEIARHLWSGEHVLQKPLELVRCDIRLGTMAEPKFPFEDIKVDFGDTLESRRKAAADWFVLRKMAALREPSSIAIGRNSSDAAS